jgi:hypothetical protein
MLIDQLLPEWDVGERHSILIDAPVDVVYEAVKSLTPLESPVFAGLTALRALPWLMVSPRSPRLSDPMLEGLLKFGFAALGEDAPREVAFGFVGKPWRPAPSFVGLESADEFESFDEPGYVKTVANFATSRRGARTKLETETRVLALGTGARAMFESYWLLIGRSSAAIRKSWLNAIKRRAESS